MNYFNKDGHLNDLGIALYADAIKFNKVTELPAAFKHLDDCEACQHTVVDFSAIMMDVAQGAVEDHPYFGQNKNAIAETEQSKGKEVAPKGGSNIRTLMFRIAAAAVIAALMFFGYQQFRQSAAPEIVEAPKEKIKASENPTKDEIIPPSKEVVVENKEPEQKEKQEIVNPKPIEPKNDTPEVKDNNRELFAANYIPNEDYESILESNFRSTTFKAKLPANDAVFNQGTNILFVWESNNPLKMTILDNEEEEQFTQTINDQSFNFSDSLKPGIYYWKLETTADLLHLGKFVID